LFFDPCNPLDIADALARLESDPPLEASLIARGKQRAAEFGSARDMAARYLDAFEMIVAARERTHGDGPGEY
jgi:hypothetical protein